MFLKIKGIATKIDRSLLTENYPPKKHFVSSGQTNLVGDIHICYRSEV